MAVTHTIRGGVTSSSGNAGVSSSYTETGNVEININENLPAGASNQLITVAFTIASLQSLYIVASQACTIKTNSSGTPAQTISLQPNMPYEWSVSPGYFSNPITTDVTAFYVTSTLACLLQAKILTS